MAHYTLLAKGSESPSQQYGDHDGSATDNDLFMEKNLPLQPQKPFYRQHSKLIIFHSVLFTFNLVFCIAIWHWARKNCPFEVYKPSLVYSKFNSQEDTSS